MTTIEREALELAAKRCVGRYGVEHVLAWKDLASRGLVRGMRDATGAWYEITEKGSRALAEAGCQLAGDR